jgi:hypothetical protein
MGCDSVPVAIAPEFHAKIVDGDEQDVGLGENPGVRAEASRNH